MNLKTKSAWLVTWDWSGDHAKVEDPVAAILNYRVTPEKVSRFMEQLYCSYSYSHAEKLSVAKSRKANPYPAQYGQLKGMSWQGQITCGDNPWLFARMVSNLHIGKDAEGNERLVWDERPLPELAD